MAAPLQRLRGQSLMETIEQGQQQGVWLQITGRPRPWGLHPDGEVDARQMAALPQRQAIQAVGG